MGHWGCKGQEKGEEVEGRVNHCDSNSNKI